TFLFLLAVASGSLSILSDGERFLLIPLDSTNDLTRSESPSKPDWSPCDGIQARISRSKIDFRVWRTRAHGRLQHTPGFVFDLQRDSICVQLRQQSYREPREQDSSPAIATNPVMPRSLLFLLVMLPGAGPTQSVRRPDYAIDTGLPDAALTKYEKSGWLYRKLMEKDPYYHVPPKYLAEAKKLDTAFGKKSGLVSPDVLKEKIERHILPHQTHLRLSQPQQAQWASYRNPEMVKSALTKEESAKRIFAANPYMQYVSGGNPLDPYTAAKSAEGGTRLGPNLDELKARLPNTETRVVKPLGRQFQPPKPWETADGGKIPKRLAPLPFLDKANARREAANKVLGQKNPPGFVHWPQPAPKYLRDAEKYALSNEGRLKILENGGVRAAINSDNPVIKDATFRHYDQIEHLAPRRSEWEKAELMKETQRISEAFKWERIKDKLKDTNNHLVAHLKAAGKNLPQEFKKQKQYVVQKAKKIMTEHGRYGKNEMHAERNKLFRRERVSSHPMLAAWYAALLLEDGMEGHFPHISDKDNRHYGKPSPYAGGPYNPIQSTFNEHGPFRSWQPDRLSTKCIGTQYGHVDDKDCFTNNQWGAGWGMLPRQHSLSHPAEYQMAGGMQFSQEDRANQRRKWIKAGTMQHEIEQTARKDWQEEEEFHYPQRWSAYRRDDMPRFKVQGSKYKSSVFSHLVQATAPRSKNWNLQYVQDHEYPAPKTLGAYIPHNKDPKKGIRPFKEPPPNLQMSPDFPHMEGDLRRPDPSGSGAISNPMAALVYEEEKDLRNPRVTYQKSFGTNPQGLHPTDPGIPDIIMEGRVICYGDVGAKDAQISLIFGNYTKYIEDDRIGLNHISSAFTDDEGRFKLETTMDFAPHKLGVEIFHQCKESRREKLDGKGEQGFKQLELKYGDRRVYDLGLIDSSDPDYKWIRTERQIEGVEYQGEGRVPEMARLRPCIGNEDILDCVDEVGIDEKKGVSDLTMEEDVIEGKNLFGLDRDVPQFVRQIVRH
ncbi:hypothetical protein PRIPAC_94426, partial [Pristionchus pacificus]|uniref:Uncharacterized protein n=1 Tax=Pristionchus pacificus TaxID=54126 RepID=A0A2A6BPW3_PRIPA